MILSALHVVAPLSGFLAASASATQFCHLHPSKTTDLCFALTSSQNSSTETKDLSLHISARFPAPGTGWAAVGIGHQMAGSLMFVMYPSSSAAEDEDVTVSMRTTSGHTGPVTLSASTLAGHKGPDIHVTRKWVDNDLYNVQVTCYGCEKWSGSTLDVMSANQTWIWAWNGKQETGTANEKIKLKRHEDRGMLVFFLPHSPSKLYSLIPLASFRLTSQRGCLSRYVHQLLRLRGLRHGSSIRCQNLNTIHIRTTGKAPRTQCLRPRFNARLHPLFFLPNLVFRPSSNPFRPRKILQIPLGHSTRRFWIHSHWVWDGINNIFQTWQQIQDDASVAWDIFRAGGCGAELAWVAASCDFCEDWEENCCL